MAGHPSLLRSCVVPPGRLDLQLPPPAHGLACIFSHLSAARGPHPLLTRYKSSVQSSAETAADETNEELVQQVVMGGSARCSCASCYSSSSLSCPIGCSARFCSAVCFATHQASCPFVTFAKPVMITFHESLTGASTGWRSVMFQRSFSATGCFTAGSLHPLARTPAVEFWASLAPLL